MRRWKRKTDIGTIILHWFLVVSLVISVLSGLRIASDGLGSNLANMLGYFLPAHNVWFLHISAGISLLAIACAYPIYLSGTGLARRVLLDRARLQSLATPGPARRGALNLILYWLLFALIIAQLASGLLLHRGYAGFCCAIICRHLVHPRLYGRTYPHPHGLRRGEPIDARLSPGRSSYGT